MQARPVLYQRLTGEIRGLWVVAWIPVALYQTPSIIWEIPSIICGISYSWCTWISKALIGVGLALISPFHVWQGGGKLHTAPGKVRAMGSWGGSMEEVEFAVPHGQKWSRPEGMGMQSRSWHLKKEVVTGRFAGSRCGRRRRVQGQGRMVQLVQVQKEGGWRQRGGNFWECLLRRLRIFLFFFFIVSACGRLAVQSYGYILRVLGCRGSFSSWAHVCRTCFKRWKNMALG